MNDIIQKYVEKIKELHECPADVIMNSVWETVLIQFLSESLKQLNSDAIIQINMQPVQEDENNEKL